MIDILKKQIGSLKDFLELNYISLKTKNGEIYIGEKSNGFIKYKIKIDENTTFEVARNEDFDEKEISVLNFFVKITFDTYLKEGYLNLMDNENHNYYKVNGFLNYINQSNITLKDELVKILIETIKVKDQETYEHSKGVAYYSKLISSKFFNDENKIKDIEIAALLHDIGKISIKEQILFKPSSLREDEFEEIKKHPEIGYKIVSKSDVLKDVANFILLHHEWENGMGYPFGLKGDKIPIEAKIVSVSDYIEANLQGRNYTKRKTISELIRDLESLKGTKFNEEIVNKAIEVLKIIEEDGASIIY
ncbi:MAG: HD domain-containing protein [Caldisericia bacterium]|nr:HD domain-containing protein [Caldisericia bacterium]